MRRGKNGCPLEKTDVRWVDLHLLSVSPCVLESTYLGYCSTIDQGVKQLCSINLLGRAISDIVFRIGSTTGQRMKESQFRLYSNYLQVDGTSIILLLLLLLLWKVWLITNWNKGFASRLRKVFLVWAQEHFLLVTCIVNWNPYQVSTMSQRFSPTTLYSHSQASWVIGSPATPNTFREDLEIGLNNNEPLSPSK